MKTTLIVLLVFMLAALFWVLSREATDLNPVACTMEAMICPDGSSVGRVGPSCEFAPCPTAPETETPSDPLIVITSPRPNATVTSPIIVEGVARGNWFFEASFPIVVTNWDGLIIGEGIATADGEWMTTEFVPFKGTINYTVPTSTPYSRGFIIFKKDNPSGLPENDDAREFQIFFSEVASST